MTQLTTDPGYELTYVIPHEAFYRSVVNDISITVQKSCDDGGVAWEFGIVQVRNIGIRVEVMDDAFPAFLEIPRFFTDLAGGLHTDLDSVRRLLHELGFVDVTQRERATR